MDERERLWRERNRDRDWRRSDDMGRGDPRRDAGGEDRSWGGPSEDERRGYRERSYARRGGRDWQGRDYQGVSPAMQQGEYDLERRADRYQRGHAVGGIESGQNWQGRDYQGVSPAMRQGEYDLERRAERYQRDHPIGDYERGGSDEGGRYHGDAGRDRISREEWSPGAQGAGPARRGYEADRDHLRGHFSEDYEDHLFSSGVTSGGAGRHERGYGPGHDRGEYWEQRGREAGRETGEFFRRTGERVASWFGERRDFRGMGPKGYKRNDERISDEVHERLTDDPYIDASNVIIAVAGGEVTLSGTVEHRDAKHRAERIIEDVSGVSHVQNNLRVASGGMSGENVLERQARGETGAGDAIGGGSLRSSDGHSGSGRSGGGDKSR